MAETVLLSSTGKLTRQELALVPTPAGTATHKPVPHIEVVTALIETLGFRHIGIHKEEYAVEFWRVTQLSEVSVKLLIYRAFIECELDVPKHYGRQVHDMYFHPTVDDFAPRTMWSLSNAFTTVLKQLDPIPQYKATAKLATFLGTA